MEKWQIIAQEFFSDEYTKYKTEVYKSRNPAEVKFSTIDKDVLRRDLTFNALFYDLDKKEIIDLVDGKKDIKNKITRFVGEPKLRIEEDPLRILRLLRFSERYVFSIETESGLAITQNALMLSLITRERIWEEIRKAYVQSKRFTSYLNKLVIYGVADVIFQGMYITELPLSIWQMLTNSYKNISLELYFAYLFKDNSTVGLLDKMKFEYKMEHDFSRKVIFFIELLSLTPEKAAELNKKMEICGATEKEIKKWYKLCSVKGKIYKAFLKYKPSVSATELMEQGFKNKALGLEIKRLELESFKTILKKC